MSDQFVTVSKENSIGFVTLNRPPANSYNAEFMQHLNAAIDQVRADDGIKVVIVQSALERFFCAGADVKAFASNPPAVNTEMVRYAHEVLVRIGRTPKIFIAAINGHALGGGLEIALACDLRFAADGKFQMGLPEATLGLLPGNGGTQRLPRLIGKAKALDMMITGRTVGPQEALELGIVDRVFPAHELMSETRAYAETLAKGATYAIGLIKLAVNEGMAGNLSAGLAFELEGISQLFKSEDAREGFSAFLEKRKPAFKGR
jgi:enoyl-CoA hydratase/carnithine racemase